MQRSCTVCGTPFEAKRTSAKYCSGRCRKRAQRGTPAKVGAAETPADVVDLPPRTRDGGVEAATHKMLVDADRVDTPLGQAALRLAARLDAGHMDTGSALAAVAKQLTATLETAVAGAQVDEDPLDELASWRERKVAAAQGK